MPNSLKDTVTAGGSNSLKVWVGFFWVFYLFRRQWQMRYQPKHVWWPTISWFLNRLSVDINMIKVPTKPPSARSTLVNGLFSSFSYIFGQGYIITQPTLIYHCDPPPPPEKKIYISVKNKSEFTLLFFLFLYFLFLVYFFFVAEQRVTQKWVIML